MSYLTSCLFEPHPTLFTRLQGTFRTQLLRDWTLDMAQDSTIDESFRFFFDFNGLTQFDTGYSALAKLVFFQRWELRKLLTPAPCAILATGDLNFGIARMYQQIAAQILPLHIHVERLSSDALAFLDLPYWAPEAAMDRGRADLAVRASCP